jgi:hypothetical protein
MGRRCSIPSLASVGGINLRQARQRLAFLAIDCNRCQNRKVSILIDLESIFSELIPVYVRRYTLFNLSLQRNCLESRFSSNALSTPAS